jgi:hypothetical protein
MTKGIQTVLQRNNVVGSEVLTAVVMDSSILSSGQNAESQQTFRRNMSVDIQWTTQRYIPEDRSLYNSHSEDLKSYTVFLYGEATHPLKMEATCSSEALDDSQRIEPRYIPEYRTLQGIRFIKKLRTFVLYANNKHQVQ